MTFAELLETIFNHLVKGAKQLEGLKFLKKYNSHMFFFWFYH